MRRVIVIQLLLAVVAVLLSVAIALIVTDARGQTLLIVAESALLGALVVAVPTLVMAVMVKQFTPLIGQFAPIALLMGEGVKVVMTMLLIFAVAVGVHPLNWLAFLLGLILVVHGYLLAMVRKD